MSYLVPVRLGGISGILFVALVIPSFLSAPDTPVATSGSQDVIGYFNDRQDGILTNNGLLLVFAAFFFRVTTGALSRTRLHCHLGYSVFHKPELVIVP